MPCTKRGEEAHQLDGRQVVLLRLDALVFLAVATDISRQGFQALRQALSKTFGPLGRNDEDGSRAGVSVAIAVLADFGEELVMRRQHR